MENDRSKILTESVKRLLRRNALSTLRKIVNKSHAADLSAVFSYLPLADQHKLFNLLDDSESRGDMFSYLGEDHLMAFIQDMSTEEIVEVLENVPTDDVADILGRLPADQADAILQKMKKEGSEEVEGLLSYGDDTAGGIMVPDFIAMGENITAQDAIASLQKEYKDVEMPFYLYVVNEDGKLVGVSSLRQLVVVPPGTRLNELMATDVFYVQTDMDQEEVAKIVARYDLLAVPVVDDHHRLVGIVTVDDVIDIFRQEATEDILKMAGVGDEFIETQSVLRSTRIRFPWLFASVMGGVLAFFIIGRFEESINKMTFLAAFIPVIMGMGGNIGTQSSTIVVRGLATGRLNTRDIWVVVSKELSVGLILGLIYGTLVGAVAQMQHSIAMLSLAVGLAVISSMAIAALVGSFIPMAFARVNIDPAVATGPFVTTAIDIISVFFYFKIATTLLGI
ncbi:MAG: magnesium transporter [Desulfobacterales bacterium]|nr:magnesium transporter [Desulfobacterales bacterium]